MNKHKLLFLIVLTILTSAAVAASKSDLTKEKRWREQIEPSLIVGEAITLKAAGQEYLGLYAENSAEKTYGGALIVHGIGVHPAWPDVIEPLRIYLSEHGWHTLSIQMPILPNNTQAKMYAPLFDEVPGRIQAGIDFLKAKGVKNIAIVAHSLGNTMTNYYMATKPDPMLRGIVAVSATAGFPADKKMDSFTNFKTISIPYFDIYGSQDLDEVLRMAPKRATHAKSAGRKQYQQLKVEGANHFFTGMDNVLTKRVHGWLVKNITAAGSKK